MRYGLKGMKKTNRMEGDWILDISLHIHALLYIHERSG